MKMYFDDAGELIVENLLLEGQNLMSDCIQVVSEKLDDGTKDETSDLKPNTYQLLSELFCFQVVGEAVKKTFQKMVDVKLLQQVKLSTAGKTEGNKVAFGKCQLPPSEGCCSFC